jgi:hypothetical protein
MSVVRKLTRRGRPEMIVNVGDVEMKIGEGTTTAHVHPAGEYASPKFYASTMANANIHPLSPLHICFELSGYDQSKISKHAREELSRLRDVLIFNPSGRWTFAWTQAEWADDEYVGAYLRDEGGEPAFVTSLSPAGSPIKFPTDDGGGVISRVSVRSWSFAFKKCPGCKKKFACSLTMKVYYEQGVSFISSVPVVVPPPRQVREQIRTLVNREEGTLTETPLRRLATRGRFVSGGLGFRKSRNNARAGVVTEALVKTDPVTGFPAKLRTLYREFTHVYKGGLSPFEVSGLTSPADEAYEYVRKFLSYANSKLGYAVEPLEFFSYVRGAVEGNTFLVRNRAPVRISGSREPGCITPEELIAWHILSRSSLRPHVNDLQETEPDFRVDGEPVKWYFAAPRNAMRLRVPPAAVYLDKVKFTSGDDEVYRTSGAWIVVTFSPDIVPFALEKERNVTFLQEMATFRGRDLFDDSDVSQFISLISGGYEQIEWIGSDESLRSASVYDGDDWVKVKSWKERVTVLKKRFSGALLPNASRDVFFIGGEFFSYGTVPFEMYTLCKKEKKPLFCRTCSHTFFAVPNPKGHVRVWASTNCHRSTATKLDVHSGRSALQTFHAGSLNILNDISRFQVGLHSRTG